MPGSTSVNNEKKAVNVERRTWDVDVYEQKAVARQQQQQQLAVTGGKSSRQEDANQPTTKKEEFIAAPSHAIGPEGSERAYLQARKRKVTDIDERVGVSSFISMEDAVGTKKAHPTKESISIDSAVAIQITDGVTPSKSGGTGGVGFHCSVCDCYLKDSLTYLDHINGRKHQRKLGYTMRVERSSESDVLNKLNELKNAKHVQRATHDTNNEMDYHKLVREKDMDDEHRRAERQRLRKERRKRHKDIESPETMDDEPGDKFNDGNNNDDNEEEEASIDPTMAAMMGFTGFGGIGKTR
jgi:U4/U6.U5 tri-snRNP component SNU23